MVCGMNVSRSAGLASALCLLLACPHSAPGSVRVINLMESSQRPQITVLLNGEAQKDVTLEVYKGFPAGEKPSFVLLTDRNGQAVVPALRSGKYFLRASPNPNLMGELYLHIKSTAGGQNERFSMNLSYYDPPPTFEELAIAAEQSPVVETYAEFSGVVVDQASGQIPGVSIDIVVRGTKGREHAAQLHSDKLGRFSAHLPDGEYVAFFRSPGFSARIFPLTLAKAKSERELRVVLNIVNSTE
jgi:hypothetical protein